MKFAVSSTVGTLLLCAGGLAQASDDYFDLSLKELSTITVTSVFPENYLTATSSVSVVNADFWQSHGARRPADVMAALPSTMSYPSLGAHGISIRGFAHNTSSARGIATLLDGVPLNGYGFGSALYARFQWDLDSLSQLQVIRGPSSALYGSDAFHGVIALQSFASDTDLQRASASLGSDHYWHASLNASEGLGNGWRLHASVGAAEKPGEDRRYDFTDPDTGASAHGDYAYRDNTQTLMARLQSPATEAVSYGVGVYSNRYQADDHPGVGQTFSPGVSRSGEKDHADGDTWVDMIKADARWQLHDDGAVTLQAYAWRSKLDTWLDLLGQVQQSVQLTRTQENRRGLELALKQRLPANTDWQLSASYDHLGIDDRLTRYVDDNGVTLDEYREGSDGASRDVRGLVSQFKTHLFSDTLTLVYGGRVDDFSDVGSKFTPRAGAILKLDQQQAVKLLYGRAFRAPTAVEQYGIAVARGDRDLKPETIDTIELVYMIQAENWRTELVGFASDWNNGIVLTDCLLDCDGRALAYSNVSDSESRGIEWIVEAAHGPWRLRDAISYTESRGETRHANGSTTQAYYSAFPRWLAHIDVGYHWRNGIELYLANRFAHDFSTGVGSPANATSRHALGSYYRCDLSLARTFARDTDLALQVTNLFDRSNWQPSLWSAENGVEDVGRTAAVTVNHRF